MQPSTVVNASVYPPGNVYPPARRLALNSAVVSMVEKWRRYTGRKGALCQSWRRVSYKAPSSLAKKCAGNWLFMAVDLLLFVLRPGYWPGRRLFLFGRRNGAGTERLAGGFALQLFQLVGVLLGHP